MAKEEIPDRKFVSLIELQRENGCEYLKTETYTHHDSVKAMQRASADTVREEISQKISDSPFVGILVDETVNVTVHKKLIMFLKIVDDGKPRTIFIGNYTVLNGTAQTVADKILSVIGDHGIEISKVMGLGSDGAPVMTGRHNSVGVRLKHQNVYLIRVHCATHRLALAAADASRGVKKVTEYKKTVNNIFNFFKYSATRYHRLRELNKILESEGVLSLKEPCSVRWLSFGRAVKIFYDNWPAIFMEFDEEAAQRDNAVAGGLLKQIKQYSFLAITHLLMDVLPIMDRCNLVLEREDVNLVTIKPMVQSTIASLQLLLESDSLGEHESKLTREIKNNVYCGLSLTFAAANHIEGYANVRCDFITYLIERLRARFPSECTDLLTCLDASKYPDRDVEIRDYGTESLATLIANFGANRVEDGVPMVAPIHGPDL
ncbi:uncharacterized protein C17orf113-like [Ptychodera flava]|uniref:uncharacterized protein C17orf113-like n=1 Tax=Ptychodera flava TaxID=63121 RepID=UPI003969DA8E